jgi:hypothetical protein
MSLGPTLTFIFRSAGIRVNPRLISTPFPFLKRLAKLYSPYESPVLLFALILLTLPVYNFLLLNLDNKHTFRSPQHLY